MDPFGSKSKPNSKGQDSLDDLLGDLLEPEDSPRRKPAQGRGRPVKSGGKDDFYSNMAAMAENDADSDISDADVGKMAKAIAGLDDMDADLFGDKLKKKGSVKGGKPTTPRKGTTPRSTNVTPRSAVDRVASPTRSETPTSPPGSARSGSLKRKPVKPSSSAAPVNTHPPGTAPGKMTDLGRESEALRPGQPREDQRPGTVPRVRKYDFGEFDEEDPLAGLSLDEDLSLSEMGRKPAGRAAPGPVGEDQTKAAPIAPQPASPRKPSLFDRPPTRSGSGNAASEVAVEKTPAPKSAEPAPRRKEEMVFSDDDNFLDGLGIDAGDKKPASAPAASALPASSASKPRGSVLGDDDDDKRPAKSALDGLLGRGQRSASALLETKEKPKAFVLDKKYTQPKEAEKEEDDFLFGSYAPSAAGSTGGNSRPGSRRSVRFQDDDDIFGLGGAPAQRPNSSGSGVARSVPDDMKWLEDMTGGTGDTTPSSSGKSVPGSAPAKVTARPASPVKAERPASPVKATPTKGGDSGLSTRDGGVASLAGGDAERAASPDRKVGGASKLEARDWLGLKDSESDGELFIPKRVPSRSPGIAENSTTPRTPTSSRRGVGAGSAGAEGTEDEEEDSFIARAKARKQAALSNTKDKVKDTQAASVDPNVFLTQPDSPHFEGSVPAALQGGEPEARDLFAFPPARASSAPKFDTPVQRNSTAGMSGMNGHDGDFKVDPTDLLGPQSVTMATGIGGGDSPRRGLQSRHFETRNEESKSGGRFDHFLAQGAGGPGAGGLGASESPDNLHRQQLQLQQQQQLQLQQQQLQLQLQQQRLQQQAATVAVPHSQSLALGAGSLSQGSARFGLPSMSGAYLSAGASPLPIPESLQESNALLRKLEVEKEYLESLVESTRKRYEEEIAAIERSYKNRLQIMEESNHKSEARLRGEAERLMEEHLAKLKRAEQEKADLAADSFRRLEEQERTAALDQEKLKDKHRQTLGELKRDHDAAQQLLLEAKDKEIVKVAASHDTSKSLTAAVEQIEHNARDLGQLHMKLDEWKRSGLSEREIHMRAKDEQLTMLQARLVKQEGDNEQERHRLEDLIARMESQNREQLKQMEEERWKLKQETSRADAQQATLEGERRAWAQQQARERASLDKARDMFLEEQQSGLSHLTDERRSLAQERSKLNVEQKGHRERVHSETTRTAQATVEFEVLSRTMEEEKAGVSERLRQLQREEERISSERERFNERSTALEQEKQRLERLANTVKQRSADLEAVSQEATSAQSEGSQALSEARLLNSQLDQRRSEVDGQLTSLRQTEEHMAQEKLRLAKEKKDVENLKQAGLCVLCRNSLSGPGGSNQIMHKAAGSLLGGSSSYAADALGGPPLLPHPHAPPPGGVVGMTMTSMTYETVASSIANDRAVRMWKIQAIKDQEYLQEESMFLEGLKHSPYH